MLAEALDVLQHCDDDPKAAAEALGCTVSQLLKFLKKNPARRPGSTNVAIDGDFAR